MPSYLSLISWTDEGARNVKESPARLDAAKQVIKDAGGRLIFFYMLMGEYDIATLMELPDDAAASKILLNLAGQGNIRTATMRAFTEQEYRDIVGSL